MRPADLLIAVAASLTICGVDAFAQEPDTTEQGLGVGDRVRVEVADRRRAVVGSLLSVERDSVAVAGARDTVVFPLARVEKLEVSRGQRSRALEGLAGGAVAAGLMVNLLVGECQGDPGACAFGRVLGTSIAGGAGGLVGLMIGAGMHTDRWEEVPLGEVRLGAAVDRTGLRVGLRLSF